MNFEQLNIEEQIIKALKVENIEVATKIQQKAIPAIMNLENIALESQTGTGKTLAYLLPVFQMIDLSIKNNQVLIMAPTHELAMQIHNEATKLAQNSNLAIKSMPIIGNVNIKRQIENLKKKPQIIVGSPGRIYDLIKQKKIKTHTLKTFIIDEADSMLASESRNLIKNIFNSNKDQQLIIVSATISNKAFDLSRELAPDIKKISVSDQAVLAENIEHIYFHISDPRDKIKILTKAVAALKPQKAIIFVKKNSDAAILCEKLQYHGLKAIDLHGCNKKQERQKAMSDFKQGKVQLLIASDMAARGLDVKGVTHIFNLNISSDIHNYIHRIGRTGRAGEKGMAITIASTRDEKVLKRFASELKIDILKKSLKEGKLID